MCLFPESIDIGGGGIALFKIPNLYIFILFSSTQPKAIYLEEKDDNENKKEGDLQPAWKKAKYSKS